MKNNYLLRILILLCPLFSFAQSDFDCATLNPIVENNEINICEPGGNVTLNAQMNAGNQIYWYDAANSDTPIVKTSNFDAGYVSSNQSYWVSEVHEDRFTVSQQGRKTYANETSASLANRGLGFTADEAFKIISVDVFSSGDGGEAIIQLLQNRDVLEEKNIEIPAGNSSNPKRHTINLDFMVPDEGNYVLLLKKSVPLIREEGPSGDEGGFPYSLAQVGSIKNGADSGGGAGDLRTNMTYFYFYNWKIETIEMVCESDREEIKINVNDDYPEIPVIDSEYRLCGDTGHLLSDIQIENTNNLQWLDSEGSVLEIDDEIEENNQYFVLDISPSGCVSDVTEVTFIFQDFSDTPLAEESQSFEEGSNADLTSLEVEGENLRWYADENKEEELPEDTLLEDGMTYYVTQTLEGFCESNVFGITVIEVLNVADLYFEDLKYTNPVQDVAFISNNEKINALVVYDIKGK